MTQYYAFNTNELPVAFRDARQPSDWLSLSGKRLFSILESTYELQ